MSPREIVYLVIFQPCLSQDHQTIRLMEGTLKAFTVNAGLPRTFHKLLQKRKLCYSLNVRTQNRG